LVSASNRACVISEGIDYGIQCRNAVVELADLASAVKKHPTGCPAYTFVDFYKHYFPCNHLTTYEFG